MQRRELLAAALPGALWYGCGSTPPAAVPKFTSREIETMAGGQKAVELKRAQQGEGPQILEAQLLPGRGMNIYQLRAYLPGKGVVNLFEAPAVGEGAARMNGSAEDFNGNVSFMIGGSILVPYANRIRGKLFEKERLLETKIGGKTVRLPANWKGKNPGAEVHAMHGLILGQAMGAPALEATDALARASVNWDAGDFAGHWPSKTALTVSSELTDTGFSFTVKARNTGTEPLPMGVGWHPYFVFPSGNREQARLRIPASKRALVDNYDNVFPTGQLVDVAGTPYDFSGPTGAPLGKLFLDDCFVNLTKDGQGRAVSEITDPAAKYGIRVIGVSPAITAIQVYAPVDKAFVAFEPQLNWADPYSPIWKGAPTGMVELKPGEETAYTVALELFTPAA